MLPTPLTWTQADFPAEYASEVTLIGEPASERDVGERQRLRPKHCLGSLDAVPQQPAMRRYAG